METGMFKITVKVREIEAEEGALPMTSLPTLPETELVPTPAPLPGRASPMDLLQQWQREDVEWRDEMEEEEVGASAATKESSPPLPDLALAPAIQPSGEKAVSPIHMLEQRQRDYVGWRQFCEGGAGGSMTPEGDDGDRDRGGVGGEVHVEKLTLQAMAPRWNLSRWDTGPVLNSRLSTLSWGFERRAETFRRGRRFIAPLATNRTTSLQRERARCTKNPSTTLFDSAVATTSTSSLTPPIVTPRGASVLRTAREYLRRAARVPWGACADDTNTSGLTTAIAADLAHILSLSLSAASAKSLTSSVTASESDVEGQSAGHVKQQEQLQRQRRQRQRQQPDLVTVVAADALNDAAENVEPVGSVLAENVEPVGSVLADSATGAAAATTTATLAETSNDCGDEDTSSAASAVFVAHINTSWGIAGLAFRAIEKARLKSLALARVAMQPPAAPRGCPEAAGRARAAARSARDAGLAVGQRLKGIGGRRELDDLLLRHEGSSGDVNVVVREHEPELQLKLDEKVEDGHTGEIQMVPETVVGTTVAKEAEVGSNDAAAVQRLRARGDRRRGGGEGAAAATADGAMMMRKAAAMVGLSPQPEQAGVRSFGSDITCHRANDNNKKTNIKSNRDITSRSSTSASGNKLTQHILSPAGSAVGTTAVTPTRNHSYTPRAADVGY